MSDLPTRDHRSLNIVGAGDTNEGLEVIEAYIDGTLQTRQEFIDSLRGNAPVLDMGDDNHWVMLDCGPWDLLLSEDNDDR